MTSYKIHPIVVGTKIFDKSMMTYQYGQGQTYIIPIYAWYLEGGGQNVLVDTGEMSPIQSEDREKMLGGRIYTFEEGLKRWSLGPEDIDVVHAGMTAQVMLTAYKQRTTPMVEGRLASVSADRLTDPQTGISYYLARIFVDVDDIASLSTGIELYPGMPAEVLIETGERTAFEYMLSPITSSLRRSFLEE